MTPSERKKLREDASEGLGSTNRELIALLDYIDNLEARIKQDREARAEFIDAVVCKLRALLATLGDLS